MENPQNPYGNLLGQRVRVLYLNEDMGSNPETGEPYAVEGYLKDAGVRNRIVVGPNAGPEWGGPDDVALLTKFITSVAAL